MQTLSPLRLLLLAALLPLTACGPDAQAPEGPPPAADGEALTADEVADRMLARYETTVGAVDAFTVVGAGAEARYTLADDSTALDRFAPPQVTPTGDGPVTELGAQLLALQVPNVPRLVAGLRTATVEGPITRDGRRAFVFTTDDPGTMVGEPGSIPVDSTVTADLRVYVSADTYDVLEVYQAVQTPEDAEPVISRLIYSDIRETDGLWLPWRVRQIETGLDGGFSDDERMIVGGQLGIRRQQLDRMPPGPERDAQIAQLEAQQRLVAEGVAEALLEVDAVRVGD